MLSWYLFVLAITKSNKRLSQWKLHINR